MRKLVTTASLALAASAIVLAVSAAAHAQEAPAQPTTPPAMVVEIDGQQIDLSTIPTVEREAPVDMSNIHTVEKEKFSFRSTRFDGMRAHGMRKK